MKLDRNLGIGRGKYALIKLRERVAPIIAYETADVTGGLGNTYSVVLSEAIDFGDKPETDFFVIRLKDKYACAALTAYAMAANEDDPEYAIEIKKLADLAFRSPHKKRPD